ncbi:MAG: pentapeptide repeat-containing protein [Hyphomicrobiaceae bacterium]|nr:pentapeptide repeat-containing protein [Hyphomicrobiaceae bacterium]
MPETARAAADSETPVNPYSLLEAVNSSSETSHTAWLIFIGVMAYLMVAVAGVTHRDLLLETAVTLPILQVNIQLTQFFRFAPVLLVLFHLGVISQLVLLARKTLEFDAAVRALEISERRTHPLRLELHNFFFVQAVAGPHRSAIMGAFLHGMSWLTLVVLPVVLLLYIQISFLPYHDVAITWTHRLALGFDILMLILIGIFLTRAETSFFRAFWRTTLQHPMSFLVTTGVLAVVSFFSFFIATVPDEGLDRMTRAFLPRSTPEAEGRRQRFVVGFAIPYVASRADGSLWGVFHRNLMVTDQDLVSGGGRAGADEPSINLRGRDLRYARLDRADLNRADLTGAALDGASLVGADLRNVRLQCADVSELILSEDRKLARCASAREANFSRARLAGARMSGIDLRGAELEEAGLEGAEMPYALLAGANFSGARLEKADLTGGVQMQGANFLIASLQGADLTGAHAQLADFSSAGMQAVVMSYAGLEGAVLRDADLEGAHLQQAKLAGADLTGAKLAAADLRGAAVWQALPPPEANLDLADLDGLVIAAPSESEIAALSTVIGSVEDAGLRAQIGEALGHVINAAERGRWESSPERQHWHRLVLAHTSHPADYPVVLTEHLLRFMCRSRWGSGAVATGVAKRAQAQQFRGDIAAIHDRLKSQDCPASGTVSPKPLRELTLAVDNLRGD